MSAKGHTADSKPAKCILVLQGGGALGAYHIGAYEALAADDIHPDPAARDACDGCRGRESGHKDQVQGCPVGQRTF